MDFVGGIDLSERVLLVVFYVKLDIFGIHIVSVWVMFFELCGDSGV